MRQVALLGRDTAWDQALRTAAGLALYGDGPVPCPPDWEEALADPDVCAVVPTGPLEEVLLWSSRALAVGKHVLCRLPLAPSARETLDLARQARKSDAHVVVCGDLASGEAGEEVSRAASGCHPGPVTYVRLQTRIPRSDLDGQRAGILSMYGIGLVRLLTCACGRVDTVYARSRALCTNRPGEDWVVAQLRFRNGAEGLCEICALGDERSGTLDLYGPGGCHTIALAPGAESGAEARACADLVAVLAGGSPRCGARELSWAATLTEWIGQAARRDEEMARADVTTN